MFERRKKQTSLQQTHKERRRKSQFIIVWKWTCTRISEKRIICINGYARIVCSFVGIYYWIVTMMMMMTMLFLLFLLLFCKENKNSKLNWRLLRLTFLLAWSFHWTKHEAEMTTKSFVFPSHIHMRFLL